MSESLDRRMLIVIGAAAASVLLLIGSMVWSGSASSRLSETERAHEEMERVGGELKVLMAQAATIEKKTAAAATTGLLSVVEQVAESIGIKDKLVSEKSVPSASAAEEKADLTFEKLTLNELANLFYRLDNHPVLLVVSRVNMAPSFDKPDLLMLDVTVSLMKPVNANK